MTLVGDALFNLMLNAVASFWLGLLTAALIWRFARPSRASLAMIVLLLPMAKLLWDFRCGIPGSSFFWASEQGVRQRLGFFQIGFGAHPLGPSVEGHLWAMHAGGRSPQSIADLLCRALRFRVSAYAASILSFAVLCLSLLKCGARVLGLTRFHKMVRAQLGVCVDSEWRSAGRRRVRVCTSRAYAGVPFAGGLFRPYIVLPADLAEIVETTPNPSTIWLTVKRDFSLRIQGSEIKTSLDGVDFDREPAVPGHFQFGFEATREGGARVVVHITTPVHAKQ